MKQMALATLIQGTGAYPASWLRTEMETDASVDLAYYVNAAKLSEQGKFDMFFVADTPGARTKNLNVWSKYPFFTNVFEPLTLLSAVAGATKNIGLGGTVSTTFSEPYNVARMFASLDHLSGGRAAWNVVTSADVEAGGVFGFDSLPPHDERYARASEFVSVVKRLWDSWEDDAFINDQENGVYFDPEKLHPIDHHGKHFKVKGALNISRTPQGQPVVIVAGASSPGRELAAENAQLVFGSDTTIEGARAFYEDQKGRMAKFGRPREDMKILAGLAPVVGATKAEAEARYRELIGLTHPDVARMRVGRDLEADLTGLPMDEPIPLELVPAKANLHQVYFKLIVDMIHAGMTLREISMEYQRGAVAPRGTAVEIADMMEEWFTTGACDGFMLIFHTVPGLLRDFVRMVVPELQRRGLFRREYAGGTLRDMLGVSRPKSMTAKVQRDAAE